MSEEFTWNVRVYYEDTDDVGVVYYANYLKYMERARTEWLRSKGYEHKKMVKDYGVLFAVKQCSIDYIKPARLDEFITITCRLLENRGASLSFAQFINNEQGDLLSRAEIKAVCLEAETLKPTAIPDDILLELEHVN